MAADSQPLLIKRYASRRLYNTETSDYVTLEDIARFIRAGREVSIIDLKTGDDLTRQYLLQIIAEHEAGGQSVLPITVLTDLVRGYTTEVNSIVPQFLASSFEMLRQNQARMMEGVSPFGNPIAALPGFEELGRQQEAIMRGMMSGWNSAMGSGSEQPSRPAATATEDAAPASRDEDLDEIRRQLADLQSRLARL